MKQNTFEGDCGDSRSPTVMCSVRILPSFPLRKSKKKEKYNMDRIVLIIH